MCYWKQLPPSTHRSSDITELVEIRPVVRQVSVGRRQRYIASLCQFRCVASASASAESDHNPVADFVLGGMAVAASCKVRRARRNRSLFRVSYGDSIAGLVQRFQQSNGAQAVPQ